MYYPPSPYGDVQICTIEQCHFHKNNTDPHKICYNCTCSTSIGSRPRTKEEKERGLRSIHTFNGRVTEVLEEEYQDTCPQCHGKGTVTLTRPKRSS